MERFVIGAAIVAAVAIAAAATFGGSITAGDAFKFRFEHDVSDGDQIGAGGGSPASTSPTVYAATKVAIDDAAAIVTIIPEDRADVEITVANPGTLKMPTVRLDGDRLVVDGGLDRKISGCSSRDDSFSARVSGVGDVRKDQMPVITVRTPREVDFSSEGAVSARIGDAARARVRTSGCGPTTIGAVAGPLDVAASGSGSVEAGAAREAQLSLSGNGDMKAGAVAERLTVSLAGSSDVEVASVGGPLEISIAGSGNTTILGGRATSAKVSIAGSGDVEMRGDVGDLEVNIAGSGDVTVAGAASSVNASIMGAGDVEVASVSGTVKRSVLGSGEVRVGR